MHKYTRFENLSSRTRKRMWINLRRRIRTSEYGNFSTTTIIDDGCDWLDIYFLGAKRNIFYNCALVTARHELYEIVRDVAYENAEALIPHTITFIDNPKLASDGSVISTNLMVSSDDTADLSAFGGLSRYQWMAEECPRLVNSREFSVHTRTELQNDYYYGIGLLATVPDRLITTEVANNFVMNFLDGGEKGSSGEKHIATEDMMDISTHRFSNAVNVESLDL